MTDERPNRLAHRSPPNLRGRCAPQSMAAFWGRAQWELTESSRFRQFAEIGGVPSAYAWRTGPPPTGDHRQAATASRRPLPNFLPIAIAPDWASDWAPELGRWGVSKCGPCTRRRHCPTAPLPHCPNRAAQVLLTPDISTMAHESCPGLPRFSCRCLQLPDRPCGPLVGTFPRSNTASFDL